MRSKIGRLLIAAALALTPVSAATLVVASPAQAGAGCYGDYCSGKDPSTTGTNGQPCAEGARTVSSSPVKVHYTTPGAGDGEELREVGVVELRWSDRCQTNWARMTIWRSSRINQLIISQSRTNYAQVKWTAGVYGDTSSGLFWTNMIYSPHLATIAWVDCRSGCGYPNDTDWV